MSTKRCKSIVEVRTKSYEGTDVPDDRGCVAFYAATFDKEPDYVGDVLDPRSFDAWLKVFRASGERLPILWSHDINEHANNLVGYAENESVKVDAHGLLIDPAVLDLSNPVADRVYKLVQQGVVREASFAFEVLEEKRQPDGSNLITMFGRVMEASLCLLGANPRTSVEAVKSKERVRCPGCGQYGAAGTHNCWNCGRARINDLSPVSETPGVVEPDYTDDDFERKFVQLERRAEVAVLERELAALKAQDCIRRQIAAMELELLTV